jgi:hypothetical protein
MLTWFRRAVWGRWLIVWSSMHGATDGFGRISARSRNHSYKSTKIVCKNTKDDIERELPRNRSL